MGAGDTNERAKRAERRAEKMGQRLEKGLREAAQKANVPHQFARVGSMWTLFFGAEPVTDYATAKLWSGTGGRQTGAEAGGPNGVAAEAHFVRHGLQDEKAREQIRSRGDYYPSMVPSVPERFVRLMDGQRVVIAGRPWRLGKVRFIATLDRLHGVVHCSVHDREIGDDTVIFAMRCLRPPSPGNDV